MNDGKVTMKPDDDKTALVPVKVEDWTLFAGSEGQHWMRDLDLADRADLGNPHSIRETIEKAIEDKLLNDVHVLGAAENMDGPLILTVWESVPVGNKGGTKLAKVYYLNEEAALLLVTRLRTPKAIGLTKSIVRVFVAVVRGEIRQTASYVPANDVDAQIRLLAHRQKEALMIYAALPDLFSKDFLRHKVEHAVALVTGEKPVVEAPLLSVEGYLVGRGVKKAMLNSSSPVFGKRLKALYIEKYERKPGKQPRDINNAERLVYCYTERDRDLFDRVFEELFGVPPSGKLAKGPSLAKGTPITADARAAPYGVGGRRLH